MTAVATTCTTLIGTAWTGTAPGPGVATPSGTINSGSGTYIALTNYSNATGFPMQSAMQDGTTFGSVGFNVTYPGLKSANLTVGLLADYTDDGLDETLYGLFAAQTLCYCDVKPTSSSRGAGNPSYVGAFYVSEWKPVEVQVGNLTIMQYTWPISGTFIRLVS